MSNLTKQFDDIFPLWANFDRFDNYFFENGTPYITQPKNKYRWDETDEAYKLDILMPGFTKKDIDLSFKEGVLTIKCVKKVSEKDQEFYGTKTEQVFRNFPKGINADKISAEMNDGVLAIVLSKSVSEKAKSIDIK
jgi:HSP20 family molecular chaperone IbpA|tara:strand:- start:35 stop:442 length:408 start_codon:yes stop_codon:yes gene_type:complete